MKENDKNTEFYVQRIYTKDISFEAPNTPEIFQVIWNPKIKVNLGNTFTQISNTIYEVVLNITVTAMIGQEPAFLCQVKQAGIFNILGLNDEQKKRYLGTYCPDILFPYARECISNQVTRGTFPQFNLDPIDFNMLFTKSLENQSNKN